jgi:cob(I)alamin adenosyltransferase
MVPIPQEADIEVLERGIDEMEATLPELKNFILPGGHPVVSHCHVARCICRRAERLIVALDAAEKVPAIIIKFINRLSDYLFVLARWTAQELGVEEVIWKSTS